MQNGGAPYIPGDGQGAQSHIHNGQVTVKLSDIAELARCPVCMGILKETRTISVCMHRFCRKCIEAWLRTNIDNTCPQCRESFASRRNCKSDPTFDQLLKAIFGADTTRADDAFLEPPSEALAAAKTIGNDLEKLREGQRLATMRSGAAVGDDFKIHKLPTQPQQATVHVHADTSLPDAAANGFSGHGHANGAQLKGKAKYKRPASAPLFNDGTGGGGGGEGNTNKNKKIKVIHSGEDTQDEEEDYYYAEDRIMNQNTAATTTTTMVTTTPTTTTTATAVDVVPHFRSPSKGPGAPSTKYYGVRKYYPLGREKPPWYLSYYQEGNTASTTHYIKLGQFSTEEAAARIHDLHTLRSKGINPKKLSSSGSNLNFPYLSTIYVRLLAHGIAPGATPVEYEAASGKIDSAVLGVGAPPGWYPPLEKEKLTKNKGTRNGNTSRLPSGGVHVPGSKGGAGTHKNKKSKASPAALATAADIVNHNELLYSTTDVGGDAQLVDVAARRAEELAKRFSSTEMLGPSSGRPTAVVIELKPADGVPGAKTWNMNWITCPADMLISGIAQSIAQGINKGETRDQIDGGSSGVNGNGGGGSNFVVKKEDMGSLSASSIYLNAANELDANADFMAVYKEIDGAGGVMALTPTMQVRDLLLLLADCGEDLVLEYSLFK